MLNFAFGNSHVSHWWYSDHRCPPARINTLLSELRKRELTFLPECCLEVFATVALALREHDPTCGAASRISRCLLIGRPQPRCCFASRLLTRKSTIHARSASVRFLRNRDDPNHRAVGACRVTSRIRACACQPLQRRTCQPLKRRPLNQTLQPDIVHWPSVTSKHQTPEFFESRAISPT
jgi:hypothetical protein